MKKVRYTGELECVIPSLSLTVNTGDAIDVPDDFSNGDFELVVVEKLEKKPTKTEVDS